MFDLVDVGWCSYALVLLVFTYIVYNIIAVEIDFHRNINGDIVLVVFHEHDHMIVINIDD